MFAASLLFFNYYLPAAVANGGHARTYISTWRHDGKATATAATGGDGDLFCFLFFHVFPTSDGDGTNEQGGAILF